MAYSPVAEEFFCLTFVPSESFIRFLRDSQSEFYMRMEGQGSNRKDVG